MNKRKIILDACCGSRMFWFDKKDPNVLFQDIRDAEYNLCDGRKLEVHPDVVADFTAMPYPDNSFKLVVFDPPHLLKAGKNSWLNKKYNLQERKHCHSCNYDLANPITGGVLRFPGLGTLIDTKIDIDNSRLRELFN